MKFVDEARLDVQAGDGGDGCMAFLREKYRPRGGPAGGDGGNGGDVVARANGGLSTLYDYHHRHLVRGTRGENGRGKKQHGHGGDAETIEVPVGTLIYDDDSGELIADLRRDGAVAVVARGGRGGRGNARFATSTNQAPRRADPGTPGQRRAVRLELKLLADAGLVGLPNAGKSSLLARLSAAHPKVADYPFTTLVPSLGVVHCGDERSFVLADVPGLIEGAHRGQGLGHRFLRHLQRTAVLVHLVDASGGDDDAVLADFDVVRRELEEYDASLTARTAFVVASKCDLPEVGEAIDALRARFAERGVELLACSSATGEGCRDLALAIERVVVARRADEAVEDADDEREHGEAWDGDRDD